MKSESELEAILARERDRLVSRSDGSQRWRHLKSGNEYVVRGVALAEATLTPVVIYSPYYGPLVWTRPADEFHEKFTPITRESVK